MLRAYLMVSAVTIACLACGLEVFTIAGSDTWMSCCVPYH
jgi:hypothetical protein